MKDNIPKQLIHLLVRDGAPIYKGNKYDKWRSDEWHCIDYYSGNSFRTDVQTAIAAHTDFSEYGIDYEKCHSLEDGTESGFSGTGNDPIINEIINCIIVAGNGAEYKFAAHYPYVDKSAFTLVMKLISLNISLEEALKSLECKIFNTSKNYNKSEKTNYYFQYSNFHLVI